MFLIYPLGKMYCFSFTFILYLKVCYFGGVIIIEVQMDGMFVGLLFIGQDYLYDGGAYTLILVYLLKY